MNWKHWLVALVATLLSVPVLAQPEEGYNPSLEYSKARQKASVGGDDYYKAWPQLLRKRAVAAGTASFTPDDFFAWVENEYPASFPKGPATQQIDFRGCRFDYRGSYGADFYLGVCQSNGGIYTYTGGVLTDLGIKLDQFRCDARPDLCGAAGYAGNISFSNEGGATYAIFKPNYVNGKLTWLGADGKGVEIPASDLEVACARSLRLGNWGKKEGFGCNRPETNGEIRVRVPNNDCSRFVFWSKSLGKELWLNLDDPKGWRSTGLNAKANAACGVEYGDFTPAKVSAIKESDGTASLVWEFGSDFVNGFFAKDGQSVVIDPTKLYGFVLNGSHTGKDYGNGWGLGDGRKTASGDLIAPSVRMAWLENANGRYFLKFKNLACSDKVNITVHLGSGPSNNVVYAPGTDGFGLGWAGLPYRVNSSAPISQSMWTAGQGVVFNPDTGQVQYGVPLCVKK